MNGWQTKAFFMSWNGKHVLAERMRGFAMADDKGQLTEYEWPFHAFRNVMWAPDNKHLILWKGASPGKGGTGEGVAVLDADSLGTPCTEAKHTLVYKKSDDREPFSAGWSPRGTEVYVASRLFGPGPTSPSGKPTKSHVAQGAVIEKVPVGGGAPVEIFRHQGRIDGFWMPWTRYEDGSGPSEKPFQILVRTSDGLWLCDPDGGGSKEKISDLRLTDDVVWCPGQGATSNVVALLYNQVEATKEGVQMKGVYLCNLDKRTKGKPLDLEQLCDDPQVHTIWFSPKGKYFVWATAKDAFYRAPDGKPDTKVRVPLPGAEGTEIKGCFWNGREDRLAVVAGDQVFVHDTATKTSTKVASLGKEPGKSFGADPQWVGDDLIIGTYTNVGTAPLKK